MERSDPGFESATAASVHVDERATPHERQFGPEALAALQAHPRFAAAHSAASAGFIAQWQGNRILNSLVNDRGRLMISLFAVHLHLLSRPNDPHSGLTVSRMTALCSEQKFCSPGRAKAMLMLMRAFGHLAPAPNEADRRLRRLVPTECLMALHRERFRRVFEAVVMVLPEYAKAFSAQTHPDFIGLFVCRYCERFLAGFRFVDLVPHMRLFADRNAGVMILCSMVLSGETDDVYPPTLPISVPPSKLSRRFGVSRAHVRRLLQDAVNEGLLERLDGDNVRLLPRLRQGANDFMAAQFLLVAHCAREALADIGRERAGTRKGDDQPRMERSDQSFEPPIPVPEFASERATVREPSIGPDGPGPEQIAALQAHPRFAAASRTLAAGYVALWKGNRLLNVVVSDRIRLLISMFAVHLHVLGRPNDPHTGLTVSRMAAQCVEQKLCSPDRAKTMLMLMRAFGHLAPALNEADRRLRRLVPTESLMSLHRERIQRQFEAIVMVFPEHAEAFSAQSRQSFAAFYICRFSEKFLAGFRFVDCAPDIRLFVDRNAGIMILCTMLLSGEADDSFPPARPVPISASALSRRFGVSRAHVRRLLQDAESQGLLERLDGDRVRVLPRLAQAMSDFMAANFLLAADCAQGALADIGRERAVA
jgi:AraC-like DNA-binding protein